MPSHLQKLVKYGFMLVAELEACHVIDDAAFPSPARGYMVFYEQGFDMPLHQFLRSPLWYYDVELGEGCLAVFFAPGRRRGWCPGRFLGLPPPRFALVGC